MFTRARSGCMWRRPRVWSSSQECLRDCCILEIRYYYPSTITSAQLVELPRVVSQVYCWVCARDTYGDNPASACAMSRWSIHARKPAAKVPACHFPKPFFYRGPSENLCWPSDPFHCNALRRADYMRDSHRVLFVTTVPSCHLPGCRARKVTCWQGALRYGSVQAVLGTRFLKDLWAIVVSHIVADGVEE